MVKAIGILVTAAVSMLVLMWLSLHVHVWIVCWYARLWGWV